MRDVGPIRPGLVEVDEDELSDRAGLMNRDSGTPVARVEKHGAGAAAALPCRARNRPPASEETEQEQPAGAES
jgi:hypothetical protein